MNALTLYVCPQCYGTGAQVTTVRHHPDCVQPAQEGVWVPAEAWPVLILPDGMVERDIDQEWVTQAQRNHLIPDVAQPSEDRQTVVKPQDSDDRYWDDEQEKAGR